MPRFTFKVWRDKPVQLLSAKEANMFGIIRVGNVHDGTLCLRDVVPQPKVAMLVRRRQNPDFVVYKWWRRDNCVIICLQKTRFISIIYRSRARQLSERE